MAQERSDGVGQGPTWRELDAFDLDDPRAPGGPRRSPRRRAEPARRGDAAEPDLPPSANRGVETKRERSSRSEIRLGRCLGKQGWGVVGAHLDWFTGSVSAHESRDLIAFTDWHRAGGAKQGFGASEERSFLGGHAWRRWEPVSPSKRWGFDYENWEAASSGAQWFAERLAKGRGFSPSRIDFAWTFQVPGHLRSDRVARAIAKHVRRAGLTKGISGQGDVNTRYVGSSTSDRRLRIYRKDLQCPELLELFGPCMRIEVVLKADLARAWWCMWERDAESAAAAAAAHVEQMSGLVVGPVGQIPPPIIEEPADIARSAAAMVAQYGDTLFALLEEPGGAQELRHLTAEYVSRESRTAAWRSQARRGELERLGLSAVLGQVRRILQARAAATLALTESRIGA